MMHCHYATESFSHLLPSPWLLVDCRRHSEGRSRTVLMHTYNKPKQAWRVCQIQSWFYSDSLCIWLITQMKVGLFMLRPWTELPISQPAAGVYSAAGGLHSTTSLRKRTGPRTQVPRTQGSKADGIDDWMVMVNCCLMIQWEGKLLNAVYDKE